MRAYHPCGVKQLGKTICLVAFFRVFAFFYVFFFALLRAFLLFFAAFFRVYEGNTCIFHQNEGKNLERFTNLRVILAQGPC